MVVHVAGSVFRPGLYHRPPGDRVADFLDGVRIWVPSVEEPLDPLPTPGIGNGPVGLNRATAVQLQSLTGVGPSLAAAILEHRGRFGPFASIDDLLAVSGIGPAKLAGLSDQVRVAPTG